MAALRMLIVLLVAAAAGCARPNPPRLPQIEQAAQATHGGGERYRAHQRCTELAHTAEDLVACMQREGYDFITRSPTYPSPECWSARSAENATALPPHCFEHAPGTSH